MGFVLIDNAPTMIETFIGGAIVRLGGDALVEVYRRTGRTRDADLLGGVLTDLRAVTASRQGFRTQSLDESYGHMAEVVSDSATPAGVRWESFLMVSTFAPCMSLNRIVFGAGEEFDAWRAEARRSLVHSPGEEALFTLSSRGILGTSGCLPGWEVLGLIRENY